MPFALLGLPSVEDVVRKVADTLFAALSQALLPDFLRDGSVAAIKWLIALPDPANAALWPHLAQLERNMEALGFGLLGLTLTATAIRYTLAGFGASGTAHPLAAVAQTAGAAAAIVVYRWAFASAVGLANALTAQILAWPVVAHGLGRTVKVLFGGSLLVGSGSAFLALLALFAIFFAAALFLMKVAVLMAAALLFVAGPPLIAIAPVPELGRFLRLWLFVAVAVCLIPVGWCVIFATAGAISLDVTSFSGVGSQGASEIVAAKTTGVFAGLLTFALAAWWPVKLIGIAAGFATAAGGGRGQAPAGQHAAVRRLELARARLRAGIIAGGAVAGNAAGAAGAPAGGAVGAARRFAAGRRAAGPRVPQPSSATAPAGAAGVGMPSAVRGGRKNRFAARVARVRAELSEMVPAVARGLRGSGRVDEPPYAAKRNARHNRRRRRSADTVLPNRQAPATATSGQPSQGRGTSRAGSAKEPRPASQGTGTRRARTARSGQAPRPAAPPRGGESSVGARRRRKPRPVPQTPARTESERTAPEQTERQPRVSPPVPRAGTDA